MVIFGPEDTLPRTVCNGLPPCSMRLCLFCGIFARLAPACPGGSRTLYHSWGRGRCHRQKRQCRQGSGLGRRSASSVSNPFGSPVPAQGAQPFAQGGRCRICQRLYHRNRADVGGALHRQPDRPLHSGGGQKIIRQCRYRHDRAGGSSRGGDSAVAVRWTNPTVGGRQSLAGGLAVAGQGRRRGHCRAASRGRDFARCRCRRGCQRHRDSAAGRPLSHQCGIDRHRRSCRGRAPGRSHHHRPARRFGGLGAAGLYRQVRGSARANSGAGGARYGATD